MVGRGHTPRGLPRCAAGCGLAHPPLEWSAARSATLFAACLVAANCRPIGTGPMETDGARDVSNESGSYSSAAPKSIFCRKLGELGARISSQASTARCPVSPACLGKWTFPRSGALHFLFSFGDVRDSRVFRRRNIYLFPVQSNTTMGVAISRVTRIHVRV